MSRYTPWEDVALRQDWRGHHFLLQQRRNKKTNKVTFKNRRIDGILTTLFHGEQGISKALKSPDNPQKGGE